MSAVEVAAHKAILQRAHQLLAQYAPLPCSWEELWQDADAVPDGASATATAMTAVLLQLLDAAAYDSEAQLLLPAAGGAAAAAAAQAQPAAGVLREVASALQPLAGFVGRQHLAALQTMAGPEGQQLLLSGLLDKLEREQVCVRCDRCGCVCCAPQAVLSLCILPELVNAQEQCMHRPAHPITCGCCMLRCR